MKTSLAEIIIQNIEFLNLAADFEIDPDIAVRQLESISYLLKNLSGADRELFLAEVDKRLGKLEKSGAPEEQLNVLKNIRENLGIK